jgi:hypothetical protein
MKTDRNWKVVPPLNPAFDEEVAMQYLTWFKERALRQAAWANKQSFKETERAN